MTHDAYLLEGPDALGDAELLSFAAGPRGPALLTAFGTVRALANAPPRALLPHLAPAAAVRLHAALQLGARMDRPPAGEPVLDAHGAARQLAPGFAGLAQEEVHALYLDRRNRPVAIRRLTRGTESSAVVDPAQVLRPAVQLGAGAIIVAHNHPSGDPSPSAEDRAVTERLARAAEVVGVRFLDHLVFGGGAWRSLAQEGAVPRGAGMGPWSLVEPRGG